MRTSPVAEANSAAKIEEKSYLPLNHQHLRFPVNFPAICLVLLV
jgi:hypothetical protein